MEKSWKIVFIGNDVYVLMGVNGLKSFLEDYFSYVDIIDYNLLLSIMLFVNLDLFWEGMILLKYMIEKLFRL